MNFMERISKVDSRVIFALLLVIMCTALIIPIGMPMRISANTQNAFNWINANINAGDIILLSFDYDFGNMPENYTGMLAVMRMAMLKDARVITTSMWASGGLVAERAIQELAAEFTNKTYGVDFLHLGFKPGGETYISALMDDIMSAAAHVDGFGNSLSNYPIMGYVRNLRDVALVVTGGSGSPGAHQWVNMYATPTAMPYIGVIESVSIPQHAQNLQTGIMTAMIPGMRGSAEMERLTDNLGMSNAAMDAQSMVHLFVFILMFLGNLNYFLSRKKAN
jgi:hypothetical protein